MFCKDIPSVQVPRDVEYEASHRALDSYTREQGIKCKNYKFCGEVLPDWWWQCKGKYICSSCNITWCRELEFREAAECAVCYEVKPQVKFPGTCDHWFCCSCTSIVLFGKETVPDVSPVPFGCPPCPNGCVNPAVGLQCNCEEYDTVLEQWEDSDDPGFAIYNDFIDSLVETVGGTDKCPLCRKEAVFKDWEE